jgi:S-formylglutathione hydrolase
MWTPVEIAGKPADVFAPLARPRFALLFLHDLDEKTLTSSSVFTELLRKYDLACVCPHGKRCWWLDRLCAEFDPAISPEVHLLKNVLPFFRERWGLMPRSLALFGIGMGGQGSLRVAFRHPDIFPIVGGIASALDFYEVYGRGTPLDAVYDSKEQCRQDTALLHLPPTDYPRHIFYCIDPEDRLWYRGNDRLHEKMNALGIPHEIDFATRAGGHSWGYFERMADRVIAFLRERLEQESRRLL